MERVNARISVAMATYNGQSYLESQIKSILGQTLPPVEIVVYDDKSKDDTPTLLRNFAALSPIPIRIIFAEQNGGSNASFAHAIKACTGDWIALADQDDVWVEDKLEKLADLAEKNQWDGVFSDALLVDENLRSLERTLHHNSRLKKSMRQEFRQGQGFASLLQYNVVTGATLMFQARWKDLILPIGPGWIHDYWIASLLAAVGKIGICEESLILYRQHSQNQIGAKAGLSNEISQASTKASAQYLKEADLVQVLRERLESLASPGDRNIARLKQKERFLRRRYQLREHFSRRIPLLILNIFEFNYFKFSQGWRTLFKDLLIP